MTQHTSARSYWFDIVLLAILIGIINFCFLGTAPLFTPDEGRYVEIPREMLFSHQFIVPHLNGLEYFEKPPLYYWMVAGAMKLFGFSEWATRSLPATLGLLGCLVVYATARFLFNRRVGVLAALVLSSTFLYFGMSHLITMDMPLSFFLNSCLCCFLVAMQYEPGRKRSLWLWAAYIFSGLAVMTKGLIGIVFPAAIIILWMLMLRRWQLLLQIRLFSGLCIVALINLPWLILCQMQQPDFLNFYFINQQLARYATPIASRQMSLISYIGVFILGFFPWTVFLPQSLRFSLARAHQGKDRSNGLFLVIWPTFILLFFACSHSILIPYLLPIMAPLAIISARYFDRVWTRNLSFSRYVSIWLFALMSLMLASALVLLPYFKVPLSHHCYPLLIGIAVLFLLGGAISFFSSLICSLRPIVITMMLTLWLSGIAMWYVAPDISNRSIKPLAMALNVQLQAHPEAEVINYGNYHQDLPYYIHRLVTIVDWQNELTFGYNHNPNAKNWMIETPEFWQRWQSNKRVYAIMSLQDYQQFAPDHKMYFIARTLSDVLVSNQNPNT